MSVAVVFLTLCLLFLILVLTLFKARWPTTSVEFVALDDLNFVMDIARLRVLLNLSMSMDLTVHNPNRVGFRYHNCSAILRHRGNDIGEVPVLVCKCGSNKNEYFLVP